MHGEPRGGNRRIVFLLLLAIGRASPSWLGLETEAAESALHPVE